jgi:serine protease
MLQIHMSLRIALFFSICLFNITLLGCGSDSSDSKTGSSGNGQIELSGTLTVVGTVTYDWDVNNPDDSYQSNNISDNAQPLLTPVTLGGYVNESGQGEDGRTYSDGDPIDWYSASLYGGQYIQLFIGEASSGANLDLYLYQADNLTTPVLSSEGTGSYELIQVQEDNDYYIVVEATNGASGYILDVINLQDQATSGRIAHDSFLPGQAIVKFADATLQTNSTDTLKTFAQDSQLLTTGDSKEQPMLLRFDTDNEKTSLMNQLNLSQAQSTNTTQSSTEQNAADTLNIISALNQREDVIYAEPNYICRTQYTPNDEYYSLQWHYPLINVETAWDHTMGSSDVVVAVVDTGVLMDHADLTDKLTDDGYDFVSDTDLCGDGDGLDSDPSDIPDGGTGFHGTHVAGIIAAATDNSTGIAGVGGATRIMPVRAMGLDGAGTLADILQAVRYAAGMNNDSGTTPQQAADIINLSLGIYYHSQAAEELLTQIIEERNIIVVAAGGNHATGQPSYPASYPGVIGVSAINRNSVLASYSNFGGTIDITAPGGYYNSEATVANGVLSTLADDSGATAYGYMQGTSMAAPHVTGVIALMKAVRANLTPGEVQGWLAEGGLSTNLGTQGWDDQYGYGLIDAEAAVITAETGTTPSLALNVDPISLNFGTRQTPMYLKTSQVGSGTITISDISSSNEWLTVESYDTDNNGLGTYAVKVDRSKSALSEEGSHSAQLTITSSAGTETVAVNVDTGNYDSSAEGNAGVQYVMLRNPQSGTIEYITEAVEVSNGKYSFMLENVSAGEYYLVTGSNADNNDEFGGSTDSGGVYPNYSSPEVITVTEDMDGLDFSTQFWVDSSSDDSTDSTSEQGIMRFLP